MAMLSASSSPCCAMTVMATGNLRSLRHIEVELNEAGVAKEHQLAT